MRSWLKDLRSGKRMTMKQVAEAAGISECYYSQIESGARSPSVKVAKKIGEELGFLWETFFRDATA